MIQALYRTGGPAAALFPAGRLIGRVFVVGDRVRYEINRFALHDVLCRELDIFSQRESIEAVLFEDFTADHKSRTVEGGRKTEAHLRFVHETVDGPVENRLASRYPGILRVLAFAVALGDAHAGFQRIVHALEKMRVDEVVGVKNTEGVVGIVHCEGIVEELVKRFTLRMDLAFRVVDIRTVFPGDTACFIGAVIGNNPDIYQLLRIIDIF